MSTFDPLGYYKKNYGITHKGQILPKKPPYSQSIHVDPRYMDQFFEFLIPNKTIPPNAKQYKPLLEQLKYYINSIDCSILLDHVSTPQLLSSDHTHEIEPYLPSLPIDKEYLFSSPPYSADFFKTDPSSRYFYISQYQTPPQHLNILLFLSHDPNYSEYFVYPIFFVNNLQSSFQVEVERKFFNAAIDDSSVFLYVNHMYIFEYSIPIDYPTDEASTLDYIVKKILFTVSFETHFPYTDTLSYLTPYIFHFDTVFDQKYDQGQQAVLAGTSRVIQLPNST